MEQLIDAIHSAILEENLQNREHLSQRVIIRLLEENLFPYELLPYYGEGEYHQEDQKVLLEVLQELDKVEYT